MNETIKNRLKRQTFIFGLLAAIMILLCGITMGMMAVMYDLDIKFDNNVKIMCVLSCIGCMITILYGHNCILYINKIKLEDNKSNEYDSEDVPLSDLENISESIN